MKRVLRGPSLKHGMSLSWLQQKYATYRAQPPLSPPWTAPIHGVPTPRRPVTLDEGDEYSEDGGIEDRLQTQSNGNLTPR